MTRFMARRTALSGLLGIAGAGLAGCDANAKDERLIATPRITRGPFYPVNRAQENDFDMTRLADRPNAAQGQIIELSGRILNANGQPLSGAVLEIWQANHHGRYSHASDRNPAPLDANFQGFARLVTSGDGSYRLLTIKPGAYPASPRWTRPPHIHLDVSSQNSRLVTQMFFPGEALNEADGILKGLAHPKRAAAIAKPQNVREDGIARLSWDIVL